MPTRTDIPNSNSISMLEIAQQAGASTTNISLAAMGNLYSGVTYTTTGSNRLEFCEFYSNGCVGPVDTTPPFFNSPLTSGTVTTSSVQLNWVTSDNFGVTTQNLYYKINPYEQYYSVIGLSASATTYNVTGLTPNTEYEFYIIAYDAAGNSTNSVVLTVLVASEDTTPPSNVTGLVANFITDTSVQLNWNAATDDFGISGYRIYNGAGNWQATAPNQTYYNFTNLAPSTQYSYKVKAVDTSDNYSTGFSNTVTFTTDEEIVLRSFSSTSNNGSEANACADNIDKTYYHNGAGSVPTTGDTVYSNSGGTTTLSNGYYSAGARDGYRMSGGDVLNKFSCI